MLCYVCSVLYIYNINIYGLCIPITVLSLFILKYTTFFSIICNNAHTCNSLKKVKVTGNIIKYVFN